MKVRVFRSSVCVAACLAIAACNNDSPTSTTTAFLDGTSSNSEIGLIVNSTGSALTLFQLGKTAPLHQIPFGASSAVTPTGLAVSGRRAAVPLGNAASVALVDLAGERVERFFTFASGNTTGAAFVNDTTVIVANLIGNYVGKFTVGQAATAITSTVAVAPAPTAIVMAAGRAMVISGNLDVNYSPIGNGIVTAVDPATMHVIGTVQTGGTNPSDAALGPDGKLYVVNTRDYVANASVTIINPATLTAEATIPGFGAGAGAISIDANGLAYVSGFFTGTVVWDTKTRLFVRGPANPVCAKLTQAAGQPCRGAFNAQADSHGTLYQVFFGSPSEGLAPFVFVYHSGTFALQDSVSVGAGPAAIEIRSFKN